MGFPLHLQHAFTKKYNCKCIAFDGSIPKLPHPSPDIEFVKKYVDEIINVSENEMIESMRVIIERLKVIPEAAASACFVPILKNKVSIKKNTNSIIVLCGGNIDLDKLKKLF